MTLIQRGEVDRTAVKKEKDKDKETLIMYDSLKHFFNQCNKHGGYNFQVQDFYVPPVNQS
jgi:hypothetical protein